MSEKLHCFAPLVDKNTKVLVIGTMPGIASLQAAEYYAFKHNACWSIIFKLAGAETQNYAEKNKLLQKLRLLISELLK